MGRGVGDRLAERWHARTAQRAAAGEAARQAARAAGWRLPTDERRTRRIALLLAALGFGAYAVLMRVVLPVVGWPWTLVLIVLYAASGLAQMMLWRR